MLAFRITSLQLLLFYLLFLFPLYACPSILTKVMEPISIASLAIVTMHFSIGDVAEISTNKEDNIRVMNGMMFKDVPTRRKLRLKDITTKNWVHVL